MPKLGALAVVKAHPLVFSAVLAVAIGIVVYQLVKSKKHKKLKHSSRGPDDGDGGDDSPRQSEMYYYDPETKSVTADAPQSNSSNLRRRRAADSSSKTRKNNSKAKPVKEEEVSKEEKIVDDNKNIDNSKILPNKNINSAVIVSSSEAKPKEKEGVLQEVPPQTKLTVSKEVQTESTDHNENIDNSKILPDKNIDSAMSVDEKVKGYFFKNISDPDSVDCNDESDSTYSNDESDSTDSIVESTNKCYCNFKCHSTQNDDESDSTNSKILPDKNIDSAMSVDEKVNKYFLKNIADSNDEPDSTDSIIKPTQCCCNCECHSTQNDGELDPTNNKILPDKNCMPSSDSDSVSSSWSNVSSTDINDINKPKTSRAPSVCSVTSIDSESSSFTVLSGDSEVCKGCEINLVNTHTEPCNHRYMCADCAPRIFRLFKKCKICRARIERIVVEE